jgi:pyrroline-5-carboxylate reductase
MTYELGIIGAGNMAEAITRGVIGSGLLQPSQIVAADPSAPRRDLFANDLHVQVSRSNEDVASLCRTLLISTKPYQVKQVMSPLGSIIDRRTLIISIAAGISTQAIAEALDTHDDWHIVRAMPNTPMLVGEGMVAIAPGRAATAVDLATARRIFEGAAKVIQVTEDQIDAVTALSGSGPAYVYFLVEHMIRAGIEMGLTAQQSAILARTTALGAAKMLAQSADEPADLRRIVTTPGGTTHAAISHMESKNMGQTIIDALKAAQRRGREMGQ